MHTICRALFFFFFLVAAGFFFFIENYFSYTLSLRCLNIIVLKICVEPLLI